MTTIFEIFKMVKAGYLMGKAINSVAKKRGNPMAAVSLVWGSIFSDDLQFNWGIRFVSKEVIEGGKEIGLEINAPDAIFATIPKICCVLVCLENLEEATKKLSDREWACYVIQGIAHEYRHAQQIEYFESVGLDSNYALTFIASNYGYFTSPIEQDAIEYTRALTVYSKNGCLKIKSSHIKVSEAMKEVAEEIRNKKKIIDCLRA